MQVSDNEIAIVLDIIKKHAPECNVLVFGSRFKGTARNHSDLDLAFKCKSGERLGIQRAAILREDFQESELPYRVDVVDYHAVTDEFRAIINRGFFRIY